MPQARDKNRIAAKPLLAIRPLAAGGTVEVLIYGDIGESWFEATTDAKSFVNKIAAIQADELVIRINSYGGSVSDGIAIYNAIKQHPAAKKTVQIDGVAVSIASLIAMAGDSVRMFANTMMMVHAPWGFAAGNSNDMRDMADTLDVFASAMATSYAAKSGKSVDEIMPLLDDGNDHWYTAQDAVAAGFCDEIIEAESELAPIGTPVDPAADPAEDPAPLLFETDAEEMAAARGLQRFAARAPQRIAAAIRKHDIVDVGAVLLHASRLRAQVREEDIRAAADRLRTSAESASGTPTHSPAAPAAATPSPTGDSTMPRETTAAAPSADDTRATVVAALKMRNDDIVAALKPYAHLEGVVDYQIAALSDPECTIEQVRAKALEIVGKHAAPAGGGGGRVEAGADDADKFRAGVGKALLIRAGMAKNEGDNPFRGHTLREIARACVERTGRHTRGMDIREVVALGFTSTSDFPLLLGNTANSALLKGYNEAPETFPLFTSVGTLSDFKEIARAGLGIFSSLDEVPEGSEYKYGTFGENGQKVKLATYGKMFAITRQAIINDDLGAFTTVPQRMGRAAKRTIGTLVFDVLTSNPVMADGIALFHATHHNLLTGAPISTASVDAMDAAMGTQGGPDGQPVNIPLSYLIVPRALQGVANTVRQSEYEVGAATRNNTTPNIVRDTFQVISDARLDKVSATAWFGAADPNLYDTIEVSYLDGQQEPYTEQKDGWDVDGTEFKVRIDAGVFPLDYRGLAKNPGA